jgi:DNA mismatch endonuclease (patch repair protein)
MKNIKDKNSHIEKEVRKIIYSLGYRYRYRLHDKRFEGKPDLIISKLKKAVFVNGCFWHAHSCPLFRMPKSREEYWKPKMEKNVLRDIQNYKLLNKIGWNVVIIWECVLRGKLRISHEELECKISQALNEKSSLIEISGIWQE